MADRYFTYEIQRIFPTQIRDGATAEARAAKNLLAELGFDFVKEAA